MTYIALQVKVPTAQVTKEEAGAALHEVCTGLLGYVGGFVGISLLITGYNVRLDRQQRLLDKEKSEDQEKAFRLV